jgi:hypothetical protein
MHTTSAPPKTFWLTGGLALLWNAIGIVTYLTSVTMSQETLASMPEADRALIADTPAWATGAYAIAVFAGTAASVGLLVRRAWAVPVFVLSLIGILVQMGHALFGTALLAVRGPGAGVLPLLIIAIAVYLVWYSRAARRNGWIG